MGHLSRAHGKLLIPSNTAVKFVNSLHTEVMCFLIQFVGIDSQSLNSQQMTTWEWVLALIMCFRLCRNVFKIVTGGVVRWLPWEVWVAAVWGGHADCSAHHESIITSGLRCWPHWPAEQPEKAAVQTGGSRHLQDKMFSLGWWCLGTPTLQHRSVNIVQNALASTRQEITDSKM